MSVASAVHVPLIDRRVDGYRGRQHYSPKQAIFYMVHH
jgi:hypothetical protein